MNNVAKPTIIYAHSVGVLGGAERVSLAIMNGVKDQFQAVLFSPSGELATLAQANGAQWQETAAYQPTMMHPIKSYMYLQRMVALLKKWQPIAVHTGDILILRSLKRACAKLNIPLICHVHFPYDKPFMNWVFDAKTPVAHFIYCSNELRENLGPHLSSLVPSAKHEVIHNGIDTNKFRPPEKPLNNNPMRVGIIANLQKRKGHDEFLQMAKILNDKGYKLHYDIIGGDILQEPRQPYLEQLAKEFGIADSVQFHGQVSNVLPLLQQLDIVVCASHEEAFPVTILEAMACGKAIVSTNVNGIPEAIDGSSGILVDPHKPQDLAQEIAYLCDDLTVRSTIADNARVKVIDKFSITNFFIEINNLYSESLSTWKRVK